MVRISDRDKNWLLSHFKDKAYEKVLRGNVIHDYLSAEKILKGLEKINRRGCGCEYSGLARAVNKLYNEWLIENNT